MDIFKGNGRQVTAVIAGTLVAISDGMGYGWTSPMVPYLMSDGSHLKITHKQGEWLETICLIGAFCGLPFTIYFINKIGRKYSMQLAGVVATTSWAMVWWAPNIEVLLAGRFLIGMAGDMCFVAAPMYIAEIADPKIRGFLSSVIYLMMLCGMLTVYSVGAYAPYYATHLIGMVLTISQLVIFSMMPESAYFLIQHHRTDKARKSLKTLRPTIDTDSEIEKIQTSIERQSNETKTSGRPQDLILVSSNRKAIVIMTILNGAQHFAGIGVLYMNLHMILGEADSTYFDTKIAAIIFAGIMLIAALTASVLMDKFGRKILLIWSSFMTAICLLAIAVYFHLKNVGHDVRNISWIPAVAVMVYAAVFKLGLGIVPIVVTAEIFPHTIKAIGMTLADMIYIVMGIVSLQIYYILFQAYGMHIPFYLFSLLTAMVCLYTYFFIPETKGKTLDEIQQMLEGKEKELMLSKLKINDLGNSK